MINKIINKYIKKYDHYDIKLWKIVIANYNLESQMMYYSDMLVNRVYLDSEVKLKTQKTAKWNPDDIITSNVDISDKSLPSTTNSNPYN